MPEPDPVPLRWMFVDMNSFFASAEQHLRPELRGRPVGVIPVESDGSCVIAASIDAKRLGVRVGTTVPDARRLCPGIVLVKARPPVYVDLHHAVAEAITRCLPIHKTYSIDEWALELWGRERSAERATELAQGIKREMRASFSPALTCSIGIAPTRLLAKIACDLEKPDGLVVLEPAMLPARLDHLELEDLCGISRGIAGRLTAHGVRTVRDLWALTRDRAEAIWGSIEGGRWWAGFHGIDEPEVRTRRRSMGHANVLEPRFRTPDGARRMLIRLTQRVCLRLREADMVAGRVQISVSGHQPGEGFEAGAPLDDTQSTLAILRCVHQLWSRQAPVRRPLKVGVVLTGLAPRSQVTAPLFGDEHSESRLSRTMDAITTRWGPAAVYPASMHGCCHEMDEKIAFGRIPTGTRADAIKPARGPAPGSRG